MTTVVEHTKKNGRSSNRNLSKSEVFCSVLCQSRVPLSSTRTKVHVHGETPSNLCLGQIRRVKLEKSYNSFAHEQEYIQTHK